MPQAPQGEARQGPALTSAFGISLLLKGADAVLEAIGGVLMLVVSPDGVNRLVVALTQHELSEDPGDFFALHLRQAASHFGSSRSFAAAYLLSHGLSKLVLVAAIFRGRLWAYPAMIILLLLFIAYQLFRMGEAFTVGMLALTAFDAAIVWLTWREWRRRTAARAETTQRAASPS